MGIKDELKEKGERTVGMHQSLTDRWTYKIMVTLGLEPSDQLKKRAGAKQ